MSEIVMEHIQIDASSKRMSLYEDGDASIVDELMSSIWQHRYRTISSLPPPPTPSLIIAR